MTITNEQKTELRQALCEKMFELKEQGETSIKAYEVAFQNVIQDAFPDKLWWEVTNCQIYLSLLEHQNPAITIKEILEEVNDNGK